MSSCPVTENISIRLSFCSPAILSKQYSYDLKFDDELYDEFVDGTDEESKKLLARKILKSFVHLEKLPKKVEDFDREQFKADVEDFFKEQDLL